MPRRTPLRVLIFVSLAGCSDTTTPVEPEGAKVTDDAGARVDAGSRKDAGTKGDTDLAGTTHDGASDTADTINAVDASAPPKAPDPSDAGTVKTDAGPATDAGTMTTAGGAFTLSSTVYQDGKAIPSTSRCESPSPPVSWTAGPSGTKSYALTLIDVTPGISKGYVHWQIYDIPADKLELPMGVPTGAAPMALAPVKQGPNYSRTRVYTGPCGGNNMYELTLYAIDVDTLPMLTATSTSAQVQTAIDAHDLAKSTVHVTSSAN